MIKNIVEFSQKLITIKSDPGNKKELNDILELVLWELSGFTIERFEKNWVKSALVYNTQTRPNKFRILLNSHLDIIPGKEEQYVPYIKGDKLYWVWAMDMKANLVCLMYAFKNLASDLDYPIAFQLVTDEETWGFEGTKHQVDNAVRADFVLSSEPTNLDIVNKAKGILFLKITSKGKTAHGAYPWNWDNAIWKMNSFLDILNHKFPNPQDQEWKTTLNLSKIETTNNSFNKIPDDCTAWLDIRFIPEDSDIILKKITTLLPHDFEMEVVANEPALQVDESNTYISQLKEVWKNILWKDIVCYWAQWSSDARHFTRVWWAGIEFWPIWDWIWTDTEWVSISSLETYYKIIYDFLKNIKSSS